MSQLYLKIKEQKESSGIILKFRVIQSLVENIIDKLAILEMILFDELLNKWKATREVVSIFK